MAFSNTQRLSIVSLLLAAALLFLDIRAASAFSPRFKVLQNARAKRMETKVSMAWSMPNPTFAKHSFSPPTWYNELNPVARRTVYEDSVPLEYSFVTPSDDWPSSSDFTPPEDSKLSKKPARQNPLRRATKWALGRARNHQSSY